MKSPPITDEKMRANLAKQILTRTYPDIYAEVVSGGEWKPYTYLRYIAREIANAIFAGNGRILLSAPPRHCKSYLTTKWIPTWFLDNWPHKKIIVGAHSGELAVKWGRDVRSEFENNPNVISKLREDSQAAGRWNTPQGGGMLCLGAGGRALGFGSDVTILDDPIGSWEDAHSPTIKDKVWDWFSADIYSRQEPGATIIIAQQRLADDDLIGRIIDVHGAQRWTVIRLPAIAEIGDIMGRLPGQPLCPDRFDISALKRIHEDMARSLGEESWNCMYQQNPSGAGMGRVYSRFDPVMHERKGDDLQLSPDLPLQLSFDFNVNPGVHLEIGQYDRHKDLFTDVYEIHGDRQKTAPTMDAFERWVDSMGGFKWRTCEIYGDRSGKTESTNTSETDYAIIEEKMRKMGIAYTLNVPEANPPIKDRVNSFQEALVDSRGEVHYLVHERCERIREDLRRLKEGDDGLINKKDQKLSHGSDARGYSVFWQRPIGGSGTLNEIIDLGDRNRRSF